MTEFWQIIFPAILAFIGTQWAHPKILKIAIMKDLVDNPDVRKLQRSPVPVIGGIAVFFGIVIGLCSSQIMFNSPNVFMLISAMLIMLYVGTIDDILDLTPTIRFVIEILIVMWLMYINRSSINCFWGLWGVDIISNWISVPLTIFATVGIINAINLIDGVNGFSSGYCFMASTIFAIIFYATGNTVMTILAASAAGAIVPFFLHNVFGYRTRMFIGDGGTLVFGTMMSMFVISILSSKSPCAPYVTDGIGLVPFVLAVFAIPVFDTIRVMTMRIIHGKSPFSPDKTHLHHMFISLGFSHAGTTMMILLLNTIVIVAQLIAWRLDCPAEIQLYLVIGMGVIMSWGLYHSVNAMHDNSIGKKLLRKIGRATHMERKGVFLVLQRIVDKI